MTSDDSLQEKIEAALQLPLDGEPTEAADRHTEKETPSDNLTIAECSAYIYEF
jgi:hypothetical protein